MGVIVTNARQQVKAFLAGGGVARVVKVDEQDIVLCLAQRFQEQLWRPDTVYMDCVRGEQ
jgi:hypothetical protein